MVELTKSGIANVSGGDVVACPIGKCVYMEPYDSFECRDEPNYYHCTHAFGWLGEYCKDQSIARHKFRDTIDGSIGVCCSGGLSGDCYDAQGCNVTVEIWASKIKV